MRRIRILSGGLLVLCAMGAVSATSASAAWLVNGAELGATTKEPILTAAVTGKNKLEWPEGSAESIVVSCDVTEILEGFIEGKVKNGAKAIDFLMCTVDKPSGQGCIVLGGEPEEEGHIATKELTSELLEPGGTEAPKADFKPKTGTLFAVFKIVGATCNVKGTFEVTATVINGLLGGTMTAGLANVCTPSITAAAEQKLEHCLHFDATDGNEILVGIQKALFEANIGLDLASDKLWGAP